MFLPDEKQIKNREKYNVHNIFYNIFTIMLSSRLLQSVIDGKKNNYSDIFQKKKKAT